MLFTLTPAPNHTQDSRSKTAFVIRHSAFVFLRVRVSPRMPIAQFQMPPGSLPSQIIPTLTHRPRFFRKARRNAATPKKMPNHIAA